MNLRDQPIERKVLLGTLFVTLPVLMVLALVLIIQEWHTVKRTRIETAKAITGLIAANSAAALVYDDENVAHQVISGITAEPSAMVAALYGTNGHLYALYPPTAPTNTVPVSPDRADTRIEGGTLESFAPVVWLGREHGTAFVRFDLKPTLRRFQFYAGMVSLLAAAAVILAIGLAKLVQRWISQPLIELSRTAETIAHERKYSLRARKHGNDEVGVLVDAFNDMIVEVAAAEEKLKNYAADLERNVAERTSQLTTTVQQIEAFSYSVSHDMRAPLRAMQGYAQALSEECRGSLSDEQRGYLERIMRSATRLDNLIQDILTYSRISRDEMTLAPVDLDRVVHDVVTEYPNLHKSRARIDIAPELGTVNAHEPSLVQVISNLLGNAVKFIPRDRTPEIKVWSERLGNRIRLFVKDNGIGVPEKDLHRIFGIFERVHDSKAYEGTGIGLSIVKKAVEKMGGSVGVTSQVDVGSTFWFDLGAV